MAQSNWQCYCSVPCCSNNKQKQPYLSFHYFPADDRLRAAWLKAIRREEGAMFKIIRSSTYVCSYHFNEDDIYVTQKGLRRIKKGAVPSRFFWNNWGKSQRLEREEVVGDEIRTRCQEDSKLYEETSAGGFRNWETGNSDHIYALPPQPDTEAENNKQQELNVQDLHLEFKHPAVQQHPVMNSFCASDEDFRFYTRFPSEEVFMIFWHSIAPSVSRLAYWSKAQGVESGTQTHHHQLPLIDECFMFFCRIAAGMKEEVLASIFNVTVSTVIKTILAWSSYMYQILGSQPTWMTQEQVQATMPDKLKHCCPNVRVIIDCTEIHCETPSSHTLQSEAISSYRNHTTFKGLVGIAPSGAITFISKLYPGSISNKVITQTSGLMQLLLPGDGVMADKGFLIEDMLAEVGATLFILPEPNPELSATDTQKTQAVACLRVLMEKIIRRVREYRIWDGVVPLSCAASVNQLWAVCCLLTSYQGPLDSD